MIVCKFGGTSVATAHNAKKIKEIVTSNSRRKIIVVSALGKSEEFDYKITDKLFELFYAIEEGRGYDKILDDIFLRYEKLSKELNIKLNWEKQKLELINSIKTKKYTKEYLVSRGEYYSALLYSKYLKINFLDAKNYIKFNKNGKINEKLTKKMLKKLNFNKKYVIGGFYGSNKNDEILLFDRGGSDITGAIICKCLNFDIYENYTDVLGVYNKNPNIFTNAKSLPILNLKTAIKMAEFGNEVVHFDALRIMQETNSILVVKSTKMHSKLGTFVVNCELLSDDETYTCSNKVQILIFKKLLPNQLNELYKFADILHIINQNENFYVVAKAVYISKERLKKIAGFCEMIAGNIFTIFFTNCIINKKHIKKMKKITKKLNNISIFAGFISYFNSFAVLCGKESRDAVIKNINEQFN